MLSDGCCWDANSTNYAPRLDSNPCGAFFNGACHPIWQLVYFLSGTQNPNQIGPPSCGLPVFLYSRDSQKINLDSEVLEFCLAGPPPIVFTFGTGMLHAAELIREAIDACVISSRARLF